MVCLPRRREALEQGEGGGERGERGKKGEEDMMVVRREKGKGMYI